jgi:hypothetical protein
MEMSIIRGRRLFWGRAAILLLVFLVVFSASSPFISVPAVSASSWAGWGSINTIAILPPSNEFLDTAAQELKTYLGKMSGRSWSVVQGDTGGSAIRLQVNSAAPEFANRGDEAVRLVSDASGIRIIGKTPIAVRHGAYILLEKLGVRWFFKHPAWEVVPSSLADLGPLDELQEPFYFWRYIDNPASVGEDRTATWKMRNRMFGTRDYPVYHSYAQIIDRSEYNAHPDWFLPEGRYPSYPWQLRPDHPDVVARAIQYARNFLSKPPSAGYALPVGSVPISPNDGGGWNPPYGENYQLITDKVFYLANEVAKAIKAEFPDRYVGLYVYAHYSCVPTFELEPNLLVEIATDFNYGPLTLVEQIQGMRAKGVVVGIRDYPDVWIWYKDSPMINFDRIKRLAWYASQGVRVYNGESGDGWGGHGGLTYYLISKLLWNPYADVDALLDDFYTKAFGPAKQVMKHYYEVRNTDTPSLAASFRDLEQAESLAAGNEEILERIRHLEYYNRYVWLWKNKGITNLTLDELKNFYTFITKVRDLYVVFYRYVEDGLRTELKNRGLSDSEINSLANYTPPTSAEARMMLDEALVAFGVVTPPPPSPYINPREIELRALGDTTKPKLTPLYGNYRSILVPSNGNEDVNVMVKGLVGLLQWYDSTGLLLASWSFTNLVNWTTVTFRADLPGTYILHITRSMPSGSAELWVDVPNRPASIIADPTTQVFSPGEWLPMNAPAYLGRNEEYFYVPVGTAAFRFGADVSTSDPDRHAHGELTDPNGVVYPFDFGVTTELTFDSPTPGVWKIGIDILGANRHFWLVGIAPLVWHDAKYLLVPSAGSNRSPVLDPIGNKSVVAGNQLLFTISATDPDGNPLTYSASSLPSGATFTPATRTFVWTPMANQTGTYNNVHFEVSDGSLTDSENITITVTSSTTNQPPVLSSIGNKSVVAGQALQFTISATDPNGDNLTYSASNLPQGANFNASTRTFSWTPTTGQVGTFPNVHFQVSDGSLSDFEDITITVLSQTPPSWDVNQDGAINVLDMIVIGQHWGETGSAGWIRADVNADGVVNTLDSIIVGQHWTG